MYKLSYYQHGTEFEGLTKWVDISSIPDNSVMPENANVEFLQNAVKNIPDTKVIAVRLNDTGSYQAPIPPALTGMIAICGGFMYKDVPPYYEVEVEHLTPGGYVETIYVWLPIKWNKRFLLAPGGGSRVGLVWGVSTTPQRYVDLPTCVRNGYAGVSTDGGIKTFDKYDEAWPLNDETGEIDEELIVNWRYRATHTETVIAKKIIEAAYDEKILYSYMMGTSGGGRQSLVEASRYPDDFDGIFACSPAINWNEFLMYELWCPLIQKLHNNYLPVAKLDAFRKAVWEKYGGRNNYFDYETVYRPSFRAADIIGQETEAGPITEDDAEVMQALWDGPKDKNGIPLWYGLRPGGESWLEKCAGGLWAHNDTEAGPDPIVFYMAVAYAGVWINKDRSWTWKNLTLESYYELYEKVQKEYADNDCSSVDFKQFRESGRKLLLSHGLDDTVIPCDGTFNFYKRLCDYMGGKDKVEEFLRFYPIPGDGHSNFYENGAGFSLATGMIALTEWVEEGKVPGNLMGQNLDCKDMKTINYTKEVPFLSIDPDKIELHA